MFVWAYVVSCGVLVWMATLVFGLRLYGSGIARLGDLYMYDANDLGVVLMIGIALSLLTFQTSGRMGKLVSGATLLGIGVAIARSGSRGAFVGLVAVGLALLFALPDIRALPPVAYLWLLGLGALNFLGGRSQIFLAINLVGAARSSVIAGASVVFSTIFALTLTGENPHWVLLVGIVIGLAIALATTRALESLPASARPMHDRNRARARR